MKHPHALFVYGTLLDAGVLEAVLNRKVDLDHQKSGYLAGYSVMTFPGESFPILVATKNGRAQGRVIFSLSDEDMQRINFYEGDEYEFAVAKIQVGDNRVEAIFNQVATIDVSTSVEWSLETWQKTDREAFLVDCKRYMSLYGVMSIEEADAMWRQWRSEK